MSISKIEIPIRVGHEIDHIYYRELRKAKQSAKLDTFSNYFSCIVAVCAFSFRIPFEMIHISSEIFSLITRIRHLPCDVEEMSSERCNYHMDILTNMEETDIPDAARNKIAMIRNMCKNWVTLFQKMENIVVEQKLEVAFYYSRSARFSYSFGKCIILDCKTLLSEQDVSEAVIVRCIAEIHGRHSQKKLALKIMECALGIFTFFVVPNLFFPALFTMFFVQSYVLKQLERTADLWTIQILKTNIGLVKYLKRRIECKGKEYHPTHVPLPSHRYEGMSDEQVFEIKKAQIPDKPMGLSLVSRYENALNYQSRVE